MRRQEDTSSTQPEPEPEPARVQSTDGRLALLRGDDIGAAASYVAARRTFDNSETSAIVSLICELKHWRAEWDEQQKQTPVVQSAEQPNCNPADGIATSGNAAAPNFDRSEQAGQPKVPASVKHDDKCACADGKLFICCPRCVKAGCPDSRLSVPCLVTGLQKPTLKAEQPKADAPEPEPVAPSPAPSLSAASKRQRICRDCGQIPHEMGEDQHPCDCDCHFEFEDDDLTPKSRLTAERALALAGGFERPSPETASYLRAFAALQRENEELRRRISDYSSTLETVQAERDSTIDANDNLRAEIADLRATIERQAATFYRVNQSLTDEMHHSLDLEAQIALLQSRVEDAERGSAEAKRERTTALDRLAEDQATIARLTFLLASARKDAAKLDRENDRLDAENNRYSHQHESDRLRVADLERANKEAEQEFIKANGRVHVLIAAIEGVVKAGETWLSHPHAYKDGVVVAAETILPPLRQALAEVK